MALLPASVDNTFQSPDPQEIMDILKVPVGTGIKDRTEDGNFRFLPLEEKINWLAYSWFFYDRDIDPMIHDICDQIQGGC